MKNDFNPNCFREKVFSAKDDRGEKLCYNSANMYLEVTQMFRNLLRPDSPLMITMSQITDCIFLSLFWLLCSFPVVTAGASFAALYDATFRGFREGEKHPWQRFFRVFRENWKAGIVPTLVFLVLIFALVKGMIALWNASVYAQISWMVFSGGAFAGVLVLGVLSVLFPVLSRFENSLAGLLKNTLFLAMANLPRTLLLGMLNAATVLLCVRYVFPLFFLPSLAALISTLLIEPMFKPYLNQERE